MNNFLINSIIYDDKFVYPDLEVTREDRNNNNLGNTFGTLYYTIKYNPINGNDTKNRFLEMLKNNILYPSLNIDARFLDDDVIEILNNSPYLSMLRITNEGYQVNNELLSKLASHISVYVDEKEDNLKEEYQDRVILQHGIFKHSIGEKNGKVISSYFLTHNPSDEELDIFINTVNNNSLVQATEINYRDYNPKEYKKLLKRFQEHGLRKDISITLLGNPLYDDTNSFKEIDKIVENQIDIVYNTCQDMVEEYEKEPFETNNQHRSEIEGGGITTAESYQSLLEILDSEEKHIKEMNYSPLETAVYIYRYLQQNYAYDPNYETTDAINTLRNRQLDLVAGKTTLVCAGYATLFSALMRRCNIPLFRYSTERHCRNIGRIKDSKYNTDTISVFDPTFDGSSIDDNGHFIEKESFKYFMIPPEEIAYDDPYITIPTSLVMDYDKTGEVGNIPDNERELLGFLSNDSYENHLAPLYNPDGYAIRMLELMGLQPKYKDYKEYRNFIRELNDTPIFNEIESSKVAEAYVNVMRKEGRILDSSISDKSSQIIDADIKILRDRVDRLTDFAGTFRTIKLNGNDIVIPAYFYPHDNTRKIEEFETVQEENNSIKTEKEKSTENIPSKTTYNLKRDEIIQDLPINSKEESRFKGRMTEEEIRESQVKLGFIKPDLEDKSYKVVREPQLYSLTKDEIIQDLPICSKEESRFKGRMTNEEIEASKVKIKR